MSFAGLIVFERISRVLRKLVFSAQKSRRFSAAQTINKVSVGFNRSRRHVRREPDSATSTHIGGVSAPLVSAPPENPGGFQALAGLPLRIEKDAGVFDALNRRHSGAYVKSHELPCAMREAAYFITIRSYAFVPRPIFSAWARQVRHSESGVELEKWS